MPFYLRPRIHTINGGNSLKGTIFSDSNVVKVTAPLIQQWQYRVGCENVGPFFRQEIPLKLYPLIKTIFTLEQKILFGKEI